MIGLRLPGPVIGQQTAIEQHHTGDKARRKDPNTAKIEQIQASGIGRETIVAQMGIAVDDAERGHGRPPGLKQLLGNAVTGLKRRGFEGQEPLTLQPIHGQEPTGRELRHRLRHGNVRTALKEGAIERHLLGLAAIVQFLTQPVSDLVSHLAGID